LQIRQLPDISGLTRLKSLSLASNRLWQLPGSLCCCTALRLLDCSHNLLQRLPAELTKLGALKSLKLTHNRWADGSTST
jgi:Leucine-rich repeat (LRR) protein